MNTFTNKKFVATMIVTLVILALITWIGFKMGLS